MEGFINFVLNMANHLIHSMHVHYCEDETNSIENYGIWAKQDFMCKNEDC
jgi:hypothetical protein